MARPFHPYQKDWLERLNDLYERISNVFINKDYFFATTSARDAWFAARPSELVDNVVVAIGISDPFVFYRWSAGEWRESTHLVIIGTRLSNEMPTANVFGQEGSPGDDPQAARANHQHPVPHPDSHDLIGGWRELETIALRNAIPDDLRREGMVVYVVADGVEYVLGSGLANSDWSVKPETIDAAAFSGNLSSSANTVQKVAESVDKLSSHNLVNYRLIHTNQKVFSTLSRSGQLSVGVIGDSYSDNLSDVVNFGLNYCWQKPVANQLRRAMGDAGAGWVGFGWSWYTQLRGNIRPEEVSVVLSGAWDKYSDVIDTAVVSALHTVPSPDMEGIRSSSVGAAMTVAGTTHCDSIKLFYQVTAATSSIRYSFNAGASWATINTHAGTGIASLSGVPTTAWSLRIEIVAGTPILYGLDVRRIDPGIVWHNLSPSGASAHGWSLQAGTTAWRSNITALALNLVIILLSTNDSVIDTPATFKSSMQSLINSIRVACPQCDILLISPPQSGRTDQLYPISQYRAKQQELSVENQIPLLDLQPMFGATFADYSWDSVRQWMQYDNLHPTVDGARIISWAVMQQLWGSPAAATGTGTDPEQTVQASGSFPDGIIATKTINEHTPSDVVGWYAGAVWAKTVVNPDGSNPSANYIGNLLATTKIGPNGAASVSGTSIGVVSGPKGLYPTSSGHVGTWNGGDSVVELHGSGSFDYAWGFKSGVQLFDTVSGSFAISFYLQGLQKAPGASCANDIGMVVDDFTGGYAFYHISGSASGVIPILGSIDLAPGGVFSVGGIPISGVQSAEHLTYGQAKYLTAAEFNKFITADYAQIYFPDNSTAGTDYRVTIIQETSNHALTLHCNAGQRIQAPDGTIGDSGVSVSFGSYGKIAATYWLDKRQTYFGDYVWRVVNSSYVPPVTPAETTSTIGYLIGNASNLGTLAEDDYFAVSDTSLASVVKKLSWSSLKNQLVYYLATLYASISHTHNKIIASDGSPDPAFSADADGNCTAAANVNVIAGLLNYRANSVIVTDNFTVTQAASGGTVMMNATGKTITITGGLAYGTIITVGNVTNYATTKSGGTLTVNFGSEPLFLTDTTTNTTYAGCTGFGDFIQFQSVGGAWIVLSSNYPIVKQTAITAALGSMTYTAPGTPTYSFGGGTSGGYGFATADAFRSLLKRIENDEARIADLYARLQSFGVAA